MTYEYGQWWDYLYTPKIHTGEEISRLCPNCNIKLFKAHQKNKFVCEKCDYVLRVYGMNRREEDGKSTGNNS